MALKGKYASYRRYLLVRAQRAFLRALISRLVSWSPLESPLEGFSIVIACHAKLARMMLGNLRLLARQDLRGLDRIIICFDAPDSPDLQTIRQLLQSEFPQLHFEFHHQSAHQAGVLQRIKWGWVDCWLSYATGIAAARTKHVMLHDMDAFLLDPHFVANRLAEIEQRGHQYMGIRRYVGNGIEKEDNLAYIVEMIFDAQFLRQRFKPIDLFNHVCTYKDRRVDFDILIYPQSVAGTVSTMSVDPAAWVHPSQVASQYTYLQTRAVYHAPERNNLFFIPYFLYLADDWTIMPQHRDVLMSSALTGPVDFLNGKLDLSAFSITHYQWIQTQMTALETAIAGTVREPVRDYLRAIARWAKA